MSDPEIAWRLKELHRISQHFHDRRRKQGSLDFDIEQGEDRDFRLRVGRRPSAGPGTALPSSLIEEAMLLANRTVCAYLLRHGMPVLFRVHEPPRQQDLMELMETLAEIGYSSVTARYAQEGGFVRGEGPRNAPGHSRCLPGKTAGEFRQHAHPQSPCRGPGIPAEDLGHFGLAFTGYLHFTSPIRRYPDLVIHRLVKQVLDSGGCSGKRQRSGPEVPEETGNGSLRPGGVHGQCHDGGHQAQDRGLHGLPPG
ncbi:MAG: ribonuclease catalytic domain-containing protein [Desulfobacterales bacterium]|nr:ribonuclease catalytic domain-containing protein [Desulfobacterales bacterium]